MNAGADEFGLIDRLCQRIPVLQSDGGSLGPGDDAAVLNIPSGQQVVITSDTLNAGVHFLPGTAPPDIGYKSLAVNLSDLAAMGAQPRWISLNLSLPKDSDAGAWVDDFATGMAELAVEHDVRLIGGDLTSGPLSISITAFGLTPLASVVTRSGAQAGDGVFVTGHVGMAAAVLSLIRQGGTVPEAWRQRLLRPQPRVAAGLALRGIATGMIDISDGLLADLGHILQASGFGAVIERDRIPVNETLRQYSEFDWQWPLSGGDDYELCFTAPPAASGQLAQLSNELDLPMTRIGEMTIERELVCLDEQDQPVTVTQTGWRHF